MYLLSNIIVWHDKLMPVYKRARITGVSHWYVKYCEMWTWCIHIEECVWNYVTVLCMSVKQRSEVKLQKNLVTTHTSPVDNNMYMYICTPRPYFTIFYTPMCKTGITDWILTDYMTDKLGRQRERPHLLWLTDIQRKYRIRCSGRCWLNGA